MGFAEAYSLLVALSGAGLLYVLLLFAHRRIPKQPSPDSVQQLRAEFDGLAEVVEDLTLKHEESLGRAHAKVGHYRRKLRALQEEEGIDSDEVDLGDQGGAPYQPVTQLPTRADMKREARQRLRAKGA